MSFLWDTVDLVDVETMFISGFFLLRWWDGPAYLKMQSPH